MSWCYVSDTANEETMRRVIELAVGRQRVAVT
jgi:hypothetical protein